MTPQQKKGPAQTIARPVIAVVVLAIIGLLVLSYWGGYRSDKQASAEPETETTATAEATESPEAAAAEQGSSESSEEAAEEPSGKGTVIVLIDGLNFRTGPSKSGELIRGLDEGEKLEYLATEDGWYKVKDADGNEGFVSASTQYTQLQQ
jgi:N-acetylmuramoyl-L-alanine amidase